MVHGIKRGDINEKKNNSVTILSDKELNIKAVESTINSLGYIYEGVSNEEN